MLTRCVRNTPSPLNDASIDYVETTEVAASGVDPQIACRFHNVGQDWIKVHDDHVPGVLREGSVKVLDDRLHDEPLKRVEEVNERRFRRKFELRRIHVNRFDLKASLSGVSIGFDIPPSNGIEI